MQSIPSHPFHLRSIKHYLLIFFHVLQIFFYLHSAVGIATRYGMDGPGLNPSWGEIFRTSPDRSWGPPSLLYYRYWVSFLGLKRPERGVQHPPHSSVEVKEKVSYKCTSLLGLHGLCRLNLPLPLSFIFRFPRPKPPMNFSSLPKVP